MSTHDIAPSDGRVAYRMAYRPSDNPNVKGSHEWFKWDRAYWNEHDEAGRASEESTSGFEQGYGDDWWDMDAVSQGMFDDDPNPYLGTYSEE